MRVTGRCRSCDAPIVWALTSTGKRMPLDPEPSARGNVVVEVAGNPPRVVVLKQPPQGVEAYLSHFTTCPEGPSWRKR